MDKDIEVQVAKADAKRGLVFGWAIVCKKDGKQYFDRQSDHIPEDPMIDAAMGFMRNSRAAGEMHKSDDSNSPKIDFGDKKVSGTVLFAFPFTEDIIKSLGLPAPKDTGLAIGVHIEDKATLKKFETGEYTGFSIEGKRLSQQYIDDKGNITKEENFNITKSEEDEVEMDEFANLVANRVLQKLNLIENIGGVA